MDGCWITHTDNLRILLNSTQQTSKHFAWSELDEENATQIEQRLHTIRPAHCARHLFLQRRPNLRQSFDGRARDVAHDRETRSLQRRLEQRFFELFVSAVHEPRMVGAGNVEQRRASNAVLFRKTNGELYLR